MKNLFIFSMLSVVALAFGLVAGAADTPSGQELATGRCTKCHNLGRVCRKLTTYDQEGWTTNVDRMVRKGAKVGEAEKAILISYLASLEDRSQAPWCQ